jgi:hypothetical protein
MQQQTELTKEEMQQAIRDAQVKKTQQKAKEEIDTYLKSQGQHPSQAHFDWGAGFSFITLLVCVLILTAIVKGFREIKALLLALRPYGAAPSGPPASADR